MVVDFVKQGFTVTSNPNIFMSSLSETKTASTKVKETPPQLNEREKSAARHV
jgi:hypothetical protein